MAFLSQALPPRSTLTFIELLVGALLTQQGFVTEGYSSVAMRNHWTSYYKWLQTGKWTWLAFVHQFTRLALPVLNVKSVYLAIDDTLTLRSSQKAPSSKIHHQHGNKPNLVRFVRGQCWVSLAIIATRINGDSVALPLLSRLIPGVGNTGKLVAANSLIRAIYHLFQGLKVTVLVDSWYMRRHFIECMQSKGFHVTGQVRIDTRLYDIPPERQLGKRGRPRKYGDKYTPKRIAHLKKTEATLKLYGKKQTIRYRSKLVKVRFLEGRMVIAVWSELENKDGAWKPARLFLSTDTALTPVQLIESYGRRWSTETMFNQLKLQWGLKEAWQQTRQTLHRWVHITNVAYGILQLLTCINSDEVLHLCQLSPWRKNEPITAGLIRKRLARILMHVPIQSWMNLKCKKISVLNMPIYNGSDG
nr:transposase [Marinagarivorans cellulosilyticus]